MSVGVTAVMVAVECLEVGLSTVSKAAMNGGMNRFVFVVYSNGFAAIFLLLPASLIFYWKRSPPPLTSSIICRIFVLGLLSCGVQTCTYTGFGYSSPTLSSAIGDLTPAFTFILAIISSMEKLNLRVKSSLAKSIGTIVSIVGAVGNFVTNSWSIDSDILQGSSNFNSTSSRSTDSHNKLQLLQTNWVIGGLLLTIAYFFLSLLYIVQDYPEELMVTFICCIFVTIQSAIVALIAVRDPIAWKLKPDMELIAIGSFRGSSSKSCSYMGMSQEGTCLFKPFGIVIAIAMRVTFLRDTLYLGSIVGAAVIAFWFYSLIWGQAQEEKMVNDNSIKSSSPKSPLLKNKSMESDTAKELEMDYSSGRMQNVLPFVAMVVTVVAQVTDLEVLKAAMSKGVNKYVIFVYAQALPIPIFLVWSLVIYRSSERPPLTLSTLSKIFLLAVFGCLIRLFTYVGIELSSPTLSTALHNLIPAFTFILAIIFRMEKLNWRSKSSQAKSLGTIVSIAGAFVVTFYQGPPILKTLSSGSVSFQDPLVSSSKSDWILGGISLGCAAFFGAAWIILQAIILKKFPAIMIILFFKYIFATILAALFSLAVVTDPNAWKPRFDIGLVAVLYNTITVSMIQLTLYAWCISRTGPVFVSMFNPLAIVFSVFMGFLFLGETLWLGSLIGVIIIVVGFYSVMWGKMKEEKTFEYAATTTLKSHRSYNENEPLLQ
ncbi:hypothetical protein Q3G72_034334 [Acer saccharum]|nr:hypothetical protein Q3G72_034334 [Acer saccharum]